MLLNSADAVYQQVPCVHGRVDSIWIQLRDIRFDTLGEVLRRKMQQRDMKQMRSELRDGDRVGLSNPCVNPTRRTPTWRARDL